MKKRRLGKEYVYDTMKHYYSCLSKRKIGEKLANYFICREFQKKQKSDWSVKLYCRSSNLEIFNFAPNGYFHYSMTHADLEKKPKNDLKESLIISVGKCADIGN